MRDRVHILIAFIAVLFIISHKLADPDEVIKLMSYTPRSWQAHKKTGLILSDYRDRGYTLLLGDAGLISYYSGWVCYDYYGLADKEIAHNGISEKYLEDIHPDILFNNSKISLEQGIKVSKAERQTILNYIEDSGQYELVTDIRFDYDHYLHVYLRRDMQDFEEIARRLRERAEETHAFRLSRRTFFTFGYLLI